MLCSMFNITLPSKIFCFDQILIPECTAVSSVKKKKKIKGDAQRNLKNKSQPATASWADKAH